MGSAAAAAVLDASCMGSTLTAVALMARVLRKWLRIWLRAMCLLFHLCVLAAAALLVAVLIAMLVLHALSAAVRMQPAGAM